MGITGTFADGERATVTDIEKDFNQEYYVGKEGQATTIVLDLSTD